MNLIPPALRPSNGLTEPDLTAGLLPEAEPDHDASLLRRWPHLARPGTGPHNQIASTCEEPFARARAGRALEPLPEVDVRRLAHTLRTHANLFRPVLAALLAELFVDLIAEAVTETLAHRRLS